MRDVASTLVGSKLFQMPGPNNTKTPAIYTARQSKPYTTYPYIIIDLFGLRKPDGWGLVKYVNDQGRLAVDNVEYLLASYKIFDRDRDGQISRSQDVIQELRSYLVNMPSVRRLFKEEVGGTIEVVEQIEDNSYEDKEGWVRAYTVYLSIAIQDTIVDPIGDGWIDRVIGDDIELYPTPESDPLIIDLDVTLDPSP